MTAVEAPRMRRQSEEMPTFGVAGDHYLVLRVSVSGMNPISRSRCKRSRDCERDGLISKKMSPGYGGTRGSLSRP